MKNTFKEVSKKRKEWFMSHVRHGYTVDSNGIDKAVTTIVYLDVIDVFKIKCVMNCNTFN